MKTAGVPRSSAKAHRGGMPAWRKYNYNFSLALLLSLILHALVLMLQFGAPGLGLPWLGWPGDERRADIPALQATLLEPAVVAASPVKTIPVEPIARIVRRVVAPEVSSKNVPPSPQAAPKEVPLAEVAEQPAPAPKTAVLSTDQASPWSTPAAQVAPEQDVKPDELAAAEQQASAVAQERKRIEALAQLKDEQEKLARAAAVKLRDEALERQRVEELARIEEAKKLAEQAAAAKLREETRERRRIEELARLEKEQRLAEQAAAAAAAVSVAAAATGKPEGSGKAEAGAGPTTGSGADLAQRALAQARSWTPAPVPPPAGNLRRRGNLLGRDPRDIQLVFYGEGWQQKVERIGSMNYPKLSRNRSYDALVVTVSINSDGTLAGVHIDKSSGYRELDDAVRRIVEMSAPFAAFPPDLKRSYDVVDLTRTWTFQEEGPRITSQ